MKIELSEQDIQVIFTALGELPLKIAFDVFNKINAQKNQHLDHSDKEL